MSFKKLMQNNLVTLEVLQSIFDSELPGPSSQVKMAPKIRISDILKPKTNTNTISSSVLILIYPADNQLKTVLIQRPFYNGVHGGQVSFPGGKRERDESIEQTALREANEEIGIDPNNVNIIGKLTPLFIPPSNYIVYPFVGYMNKRPVFVPDSFEVMDIIEVELDFFLDKQNYKSEFIAMSSGEKLQTPCFIYNEKIVWGATAMIIMEMADLVNHYFEVTN